MKKQMLAVMSALLFVLVAGVYAQAPDGITVNVPYSFMVNGKQLPAGRYTIQTTGMTDSFLLIRSEDGKNAVQCDYITRIDAGSASQPRIVLDKYENRYVLSEVFFPGEDGFLLTGSTKAAHKHETIKAIRKTS